MLGDARRKPLDGCTFDGRSRVLAAREAGGKWFRLRRPTRLTEQEATFFREVYVSEVLLRRRGSRAALLLSWS